MKKPFHKTPKWIQKCYPDYIWQVDTGRKELFLTFDDGPLPGVTDFVLHQLAAFQAKATFFCVGENLVKHNETAEKIVQEGHLLANHTFNHLKGWQTKNFHYLHNTLECERAIALFQEPKKIFRPPYGRIKKTQAKALKGFQIVMWNRLAWDFDPRVNTRNALKYLTDDAPPGSIFVFHDNVKAEKNLKALLPEVLSYYTDRGFVFSRLDSH